jgi:hypothetical protein
MSVELPLLCVGYQYCIGAKGCGASDNQQHRTLCFNARSNATHFSARALRGTHCHKIDAIDQ